MKVITKTTRYWLFKPIGEIKSYYFVRVVTDTLDEKPYWGIGYENHLGLVSFVGNPLSDEQQAELETEFINELLAVECDE